MTRRRKGRYKIEYRQSIETGGWYWSAVGHATGRRYVSDFRHKTKRSARRAARRWLDNVDDWSA